MLTLDPNSVCDVCAEEYGPFNLPRSIPCGHILCETCSSTIVEKTSPRSSPMCPFCREPFTADGVRVIRVDCSSMAINNSRGSTPRPKPAFSPEANEETIVWDRRADDERAAAADTDPTRHRAEARRLEEKVAKVAAKRSSVEEVEVLLRDLRVWLSADAQTPDPSRGSLELSAALLRAIITNYHAHVRAVEVAKGVENTLRGRIEDGELTRQKLEAELRKQKALVTQKTQDVVMLKAELARLKGTPIPTSTVSSSASAATPQVTSTATPTRSATPSRRQSITTGSPSTATAPAGETFPVSPTVTSSASAAAGMMSNTSASPSPLRYHSRTSSLYGSNSRPTTPSPMNTSAASVRSMTPGPGHVARATTPAPPVPPLPRSMTPAVSSHGHAHPHAHHASHNYHSHSQSLSQAQAQAMSRPPVPPKPRTLSGQSPPPKRESVDFRLVDDRDGDAHAAHEARREERREKDRKKERKSKHERWLPTGILGLGVSRPATSMN